MKPFNVTLPRSKILSEKMNSALKRHYVLVGILFFSFVLRLLWVKMPILGDEGEAGYNAMLWTWGYLPYVYRFPLTGFPKPPLYYLLYAIPISFFGNTIIPIRIFNDIIFFTSIIALYEIVKIWYNKKAALFSILFYGTFMSAPALEGQFALASSMAFPFFIFSVFFSIKYLKTKSRVSLLLSGVFFSASLLIHQGQVFGIGLLLFMMLSHRHLVFKDKVEKRSEFMKNSIEDLLAFIISIFSLIIIFVVYYWMHGGLSNLIESQILGFTLTRDILASFKPPFGWKALTFLEGLPLWLFSSFGLIICILRRHKNDWSLVCWAFVFFIMILIQGKFFGHKIIAILPPAAILSGVALSLTLDKIKFGSIQRFFKDYKQNAASIFVMFILLISFIPSVAFQTMQYPNYGMRWEFVSYPYLYAGSYDKQMELVDYLESHVLEGEKVLVYGWMPEVYWLAELKAPSIYLNPVDIGVSIPEEEYQRLLESVGNGDFRYIVVAYPFYPFKPSDPIFQAISEKYFNVKRIGERRDKYLMIYSKYSQTGEWIYYSFAENLANAEKYDILSGIKRESTFIPKIEEITINEITRDAIFHHPPLGKNSTSYIWYDGIQVPSNLKQVKFKFGIAISPKVWDEAGDGVLFEILVDSDGGIKKIFSEYINPKEDVQERNWLDYEVDLTEYSGKIIGIYFATNSGPNGDATYDHAYWSNPKIYVKDL